MDVKLHSKSLATMMAVFEETRASEARELARI
jgi:hypothetical protein